MKAFNAWIDMRGPFSEGPLHFVVGRLARALVLGMLGLCSAQAQAWVLNLTAGPKQIYLAVGRATVGGNNSTINQVSVTLPAAAVGNGVAQAMTSNSSQSTSPYDNYAVCNPPAQVYVGGSLRVPSGSSSATLQVSTPASLASGADTIPFSQISWTSTANGNAAADIPAGAFNGGTVFLRTIAANTYVENCLTYSYANTVVPAAGTYTGRATFTLTAP